MNDRHVTTVSITVLVLAVTMSGPARADEYDPSSLCVSATPTAADLTTMLATIQANTVAEISAAGGVSVHREDSRESETYALDVAQQLSRDDLDVHTPFTAYAAHHFREGVTGVVYAGHIKGDTDDEAGQITLRALAKNQIWVREAYLDDKMTIAEMNLQAVKVSDFSWLQQSAGDQDSVHTFTCAVNDSAQLLLTDQHVEEGVPESAAFTVDFTPDGALAEVRNTWTSAPSKAPIVRTSTLTYPGATIRLPASISAQQWQILQVRTTFAALAAHSLSAARAKVKNVSGHAARVGAVRRVAKAHAAGFFWTARSTRVPDGARVSTAKPNGSKSSWKFTMTVVGTKVRMTSNLP
jgi:hypothetical protein